ncbi:MAG: amidohydrolase family protein [Planctomycetaceae bacterium]|jgi:N-acetylglucosamine-6-phosphate deacetylase|nr:amidohydrolase family protein [Planctomycetaceae bacterium]MBT4723639.1 amidohydrolase family protein [Planctomycetaceae bacterium]MBT4845505.1 amidohydrolase family protein [Planctomycetaceae bacterium]MBT5125326.1 amidohydrolase family protein [Planctomycetaceae bacterium]MBT5598906.1 amidohydrolase family protein [Planctomycetaceae bacterium]
MTLSSIQARHYDTDDPIVVSFDDGVICDISPLESRSENVLVLAPGLVDVQVNGYGGQEFNDPELTAEKVLQICLAMDRDGVTQFCPTFTTQSFELLRHSMATVAQAIDEHADIADRCTVLHLEGPYISDEDGPRGAHPLEHVRPPCWDEFQQLQSAARGKIGILTLSPEFPQAEQFIQQVVDSGVVVAIGHTAASSMQITAAIDAGATMSTHLGNGAHGTIRRHPNYIWDQIAADELTCSLIADGHHLPTSVIKSIIRAKTSERCVLVSDITGMGGMPPGKYTSSGLGDVEVLENGRLVVPGQSQLLAGASFPIGAGIATLTENAGIDLGTAVDMASIGPANIIKHELAPLEVDAGVDLVFFEIRDGKFVVHTTVNRGRIVYQAS